MATGIRRIITERVSTAFNYTFPTLFSSEHFIPSLVRVSKRKSDHPQLLFPLSSVLEKSGINPADVNPSVLLPSLKGEHMISSDGILDISIGDDKHQNIVFSMHKQKFIHEVLNNTYKDLEGPYSSSCILQSIPHQRVVIDFSSPNIAKPFHAGHLRSTIIGNFIGNLHMFLGHKVTRINYLGDWGTQYGLLSAGFNEFGSEEELHKDPIRHLLQVYIASNQRATDDILFQTKARETFTELEKGDKKLLEQWTKFRNLSIEEYSLMYERLGVYFDEYHGESMYSLGAQKIIEELKTKFNLEKASDGTIKITVPTEDDQELNVTLEKSDGSTLYLSRDIAAALDRKAKYKFHKAYYVVDNGQTHHFEALFNILKMMGYDWYSSMVHVKFGRIEGLSTRKGKLVYLKDLLNEARSKALSAMKNSSTTRATDWEGTADVLGVSGIIINDMKGRRKNNYVFSWENALNQKGNTAITLQYNHARLCGLEENCGVNFNPYCETKYLLEPEALHLVQHIARFDEVLMEAYTALEPCVIVQYLFVLCNLIGKANKVLPVKDQDKVIAWSRLFLFHTSRKVLHVGMKILGLQPLEEM